MKSEGWRWEQRDDVTLFEILNALWGRRLLVGAIAATMMVSGTLLALLWGPAHVARAALSVQATDDGLGPEDPISGEADPTARADAGQSSEALIQRVEEEVPQRDDLSRETMRRVGYTSGLEEFNERLELEEDYRPGEILVTFSAEEAEVARRVANEYARVFVERTEELNRQGLVGGTLAAEVEVAREAELVRGRATTSLLYGFAAGFAGLLVGGGVAFALESRTRRWRGARDAELTLRAPVLGVIPDYAPEEKVVELGPTVAPEAAWALDRGSSPGGSFRELAENLLSVSEGEIGSVVVTSPERGAGRTSVCLGLGAALAGRSDGRGVAVLDCNLDRPCLHRLFDKPNFTGLTNAISNGRSPGAYGFEVASGLLVVPTGPVLPGAEARMKSDGFVAAVRAMREEFGVVLLDGPVAGEVLDSPVLSRGFDGVLLVIHATRTPKSDAREATDDLLDAGVNLLGVVLNGSV